MFLLPFSLELLQTRNIISKCTLSSVLHVYFSGADSGGWGGGGGACPPPPKIGKNMIFLA